MIYLRYAYQKTGLPEPTNIVLRISDTNSVQFDVVDEFSYAFPSAKVQLNVPEGEVVDICIFAFRNSRDLLTHINLGRQHLRQARLGVGFFCISERTLYIVPGNKYYQWAGRQWMLEMTIKTLSFLLKLKKYIRERL